MLKKLLALAIMAGLSFCMSTPAVAKLGRQQLRWLTSSTAFPGSLRGDSTSFSEGAGQNVDTSLSVAIHRIRPGMGHVGRVAASDTTTWFVLQIGESGDASVTNGADSLYIGAQVSHDGKNWVTITPGETFLAAGKDGTLNGVVCMEKAANNFHLRFYSNVLLGRLNDAGATGTTAPTHLQIGSWAYARFIVQGDMTGSWTGFVQGDWEE